MSQRTSNPRCPVRLGEPCTLCFPGASGPQDCGLVYLVRTDPELREELAERRRERHAAQLGTPPAAAS
ncbi:hypothetical protein LJR027_003747 [Terrabacter sp. LjRoot27]|uniref:DUF6767 domain-containing protein n=1 Tax=Terrabacter sp. LjRoot27 TaxID=3342306 RepID=UPI003ECE94B2